MSNISDFNNAYEALREIYLRDYAVFCAVNPALDKKSTESKKELMESRDDEWSSKFNEAIELADNIHQSEAIKAKLSEIRTWNEKLEACKGGYIGKSILYEGIGTTPNAQPSKKFDDKI